MKVLATALIGMLIISAGCQKNDNDAPTKSEQLTAKPWKFSSAGVDANNDGTIDTPLPSGTFEPCELDNLYIFKSDGTGTADEGPLKCDANDPQTSPFGWSLSSDQSQITFTGGGVQGIDGTVKLISLTDSKLVMSQSVDIGIPIPVTVVVELVH
ncbi:MAG: lipocalin family protein [Flavitalea sp.]